RLPVGAALHTRPPGEVADGHADVLLLSGRPRPLVDQPVDAAPHLRAPTGVKWVVFGGGNELLSDWMGCNVEETIPVKFNGKAVGPWEVCVGMADGQDVVIRRPAAASVISDESKYRRPAS